MKKDRIKTQARFPLSLHKRIYAEADLEGRSFNAEVVYRLEAAYRELDKKRNVPSAPTLETSDLVR